MGLAIASPAFAHNDNIPRRFTCDGDDLPPELNWDGIPPGCESLALIVDDPDAPDPAAPRMTWVHWVLYNIPAASRGLAEGGRPLPAGTAEGLNNWDRTGYGGPCPPIGRHRYFFKLYALDTALSGLDRPSKADIEAAMQGHVLDRAELIGTYQR